MPRARFTVTLVIFLFQAVTVRIAPASEESGCLVKAMRFLAEKHSGLPEMLRELKRDDRLFALAKTDQERATLAKDLVKGLTHYLNTIASSDPVHKYEITVSADGYFLSFFISNAEDKIPRTGSLLERAARRVSTDGFEFRFDPLELQRESALGLFSSSKKAIYLPLDEFLALRPGWVGAHELGHWYADRLEKRLGGDAPLAGWYEARTAPGQVKSRAYIDYGTGNEVWQHAKDIVSSGRPEGSRIHSRQNIEIVAEQMEAYLANALTQVTQKPADKFIPSTNDSPSTRDFPYPIVNFQHSNGTFSMPMNLRLARIWAAYHLETNADRRDQMALEYKEALLQLLQNQKAIYSTMSRDSSEELRLTLARKYREANAEDRSRDLELASATVDSLTGRVPEGALEGIEKFDPDAMASVKPIANFHNPNGQNVRATLRNILGNTPNLEERKAHHIVAQVQLIRIAPSLSERARHEVRLRALLGPNPELVEIEKGEMLPEIPSGFSIGARKWSDILQSHATAYMGDQTPAIRARDAGRRSGIFTTHYSPAEIRTALSIALKNTNPHGDALRHSETVRVNLGTGKSLEIKVDLKRASLTDPWDVIWLQPIQGDGVTNINGERIKNEFRRARSISGP